MMEEQNGAKNISRSQQERVTTISEYQNAAFTGLDESSTTDISSVEAIFPRQKYLKDVRTSSIAIKSSEKNTKTISKWWKFSVSVTVALFTAVLISASISFIAIQLYRKGQPARMERRIEEISMFLQALAKKMSEQDVVSHTLQQKFEGQDTKIKKNMVGVYSSFQTFDTEIVTLNDTIFQFHKKETGCPHWAHSFTFNRATNTCYKVVDWSISWTKAKLVCEMGSGHLLRIKSAEMFHTFRQILGLDQEPKQYYWIDGTDSLHEGTFLSHRGDVIPWVRWSPNQPSGDHYDCLGMRNDGIGDIVCTNEYKKKFICETGVQE